MGPTRAISFCDLVTDLLQRLLDTDADAHLIVCATRDEFLAQLSAAIRSQHADSNTTPNHDLLTKSIRLLAKSSRIRLVFCPSLESLRAYLAVLTPVNMVTCEDTTQRSRQLLVILDIVALHATTSEFSAQGLSRTLASAVEATARVGMDLRLCECKDAADPDNADHGERLWTVHVPLLNGSVRIRGEDGSWGGRGASVKRVAQRWFEFEDSRNRRGKLV